MTKESVLVFGLDGATWKILNPLLKENKLPYLKKLINQGSKHTLKSTIPPLTGAAWTSFQTGANPGQHGIFEFIKRNNSLISSKDVKLPKIWDIIAKKDLKSCIINMPVTYPPKKINGILISSFLSQADNYFSQSLKPTLDKLGYKIDLDKPFNLAEKAKNKGNSYKEIHQLAKTRVKVAKTLIGKEPWDLFFCLFKSVDLVQHLDYNGPETEKLFIYLDQKIEEIVKKFSRKYPKRNLHIIIMSDHGFHQNYTKDIAFYPFLRSLNLIPNYPKPILRFARLVRKIFSIKSKYKKIISFGMFEKNKSKRNLIIQKLQQAEVEGKKVFKTVTSAEKLYGPNYQKSIPDIIWMTTKYFAPNPDPLSGELTYPHPSQLAGTHQSDPNGISIIKSSSGLAGKTNKSLKIQELTTIIAKILKVPYPHYFLDTEN